MDPALWEINAIHNGALNCSSNFEVLSSNAAPEHVREMCNDARNEGLVRKVSGEAVSPVAVD